jgi:hypothetical protein
MSRGIIDGINKIRASQSMLDSNRSNFREESFDTETSTEEDVEYISDYQDPYDQLEESDQQIELEYKPSSKRPRKISPTKKQVQEQTTRNKPDTVPEAEPIQRVTPIKNRKFLEQNQQKKTVVSVQEPCLPAALKPKDKEKPVRLSTHVNREVFEKIQSLKSSGKIHSISSLVTIALAEFIEKYKLME